MEGSHYSRLASDHVVYHPSLSLQAEDEVLKGGKDPMDSKAIIAKASATMDDEYDNRKGSDSTYYSIAHTMRESITRQPSMIEFGNLKEYQVSLSLSVGGVCAM